MVILNNHKQPFFSVVVPVYNCEKYVTVAIESVINQTCGDWELVLVDDCSSDGSWAILQEYAAHFPNIKTFRNERNLNVGATVNRGIEETSGEWIVRLDSDDCFEKNYLEELLLRLDSLEDHGECFVSCWVTIIDENGNAVLEVKLPNVEVVERMMEFENFLYHVGTSFSKDAWRRVGGYPEGKLKVAEDTALWLKFFRSGMRLVMIPKPLARYRVHDSNVTALNDACLFEDEGDRRSRRAIRQYYEWRISLFLKQGRLKEAREELLKLWALQRTFSAKNFQYYLFSFLPAEVVYSLMWELRPRLRACIKDLRGRHVRV